MASKQGKAPYIDPGTLDFVLQSLRGPNAVRNSAIPHISHYLGLRAKELAALTLGDVLTPQGELRDAIRLLKHTTKSAKFREVWPSTSDDGLTKPDRSDLPEQGRRRQPGQHCFEFSPVEN